MPGRKRRAVEEERLEVGPAARGFLAGANADRDMTCRQMAILVMIAAYPNRSVKHIGAALEISKPVITRASDKLLELELINRTAADDRRQVELSCTRAGRRLLSEAGVWGVA